MAFINGILRSSRKSCCLYFAPTTLWHMNTIITRPLSFICMTRPLRSMYFYNTIGKPPCITLYCASRYSSGVSGEPTRILKSEDSVGTKAIKLLGWLGGFYSRKSILTRSALSMYKCCVEGLSYDNLYKAAVMPDTFQSWFLVCQLHVWMCLVRLKPEGEDGRYMYRRMVEILWEDVEERMKVMGVTDGRTRNNSLKELSQEFYGLILAYDEGLVSHDRVLAASLWRNMFHNSKNTDAGNLAKFVDYVRRQTLHLENLNSEVLLTTGKIEWLPFEEENV